MSLIVIEGTLIQLQCSSLVVQIGDMGSVPGLGRTRGGGHGNHSNILPWRIPMDIRAWVGYIQFMGSQRVEHN